MKPDQPSQNLDLPAPAAGPAGPAAQVLRHDRLGPESAYWRWGNVTTTLNPVLCDAAASPVSPRDLLERTAGFAEAVVAFARRVPPGPLNNRLLDQLIVAGTAVATGFCKADAAATQRDFKKSLAACQEATRESMLHLRLLAKTEDRLTPEIRRLWQEARELNLVFSAHGGK